MFLVAGILILAVVLDGVRRVRQQQRSKIRFGDVDKKVQVYGGEDYNSELPNGGARVIGRDLDPLFDEIPRESELQLQPAAIAEDEPVNLDDSVPMLMESVDKHSGRDDARLARSEDRTEVQLDAFDELIPEAEENSGFESLDPEPEPELRQAANPQRERESEPVPPPPPKASPRPPVNDSSDRRETRAAPQDVLVIHVMAERGHLFEGAALKQALLDHGLRLGDMNIFHYPLVDADDNSVDSAFSCINSIEPGTFNLATMDSMATPGVSFFLALPGPSRPVKALETMYAVARSLVDELGGELKDDTRSVLRAQTIEHYRERIREFERKQLTQSA